LAQNAGETIFLARGQKKRKGEKENGTRTAFPVLDYAGPPSGFFTISCQARRAPAIYIRDGRSRSRPTRPAPGTPPTGTPRAGQELLHPTPPVSLRDETCSGTSGFAPRAAVPPTAAVPRTSSHSKNGSFQAPRDSRRATSVPSRGRFRATPAGR